MFWATQLFTEDGWRVSSIDNFCFEAPRGLPRVERELEHVDDKLEHVDTSVESKLLANDLFESSLDDVDDDFERAIATSHCAPASARKRRVVRGRRMNDIQYIYIYIYE